MADIILKDPAFPSGPVNIHSTTVQIDRDLCIGAATCIAIAPKTFALDSDAKCVVLSTALEDTDEMVLDAARSCPTAAIIITDQNGQKIFPG